MADGSFDQWIVDGQPFETINPKTDGTGSFDRWIAQRLIFRDYANVEFTIVSDNQAAYASGAYIALPVTENWTGSNDDPWRKSHWASSTV